MQDKSVWHEVAALCDLVPNQPYPVQIDDLTFVIINNDDHYYALENLCTHDGGTLDEGCIEGEEIVCPRHGAKFCLKTGQVTAPPAYEDIKTFEVKVEHGALLIKI